METHDKQDRTVLQHENMRTTLSSRNPPKLPHVMENMCVPTNVSGLFTGGEDDETKAACSPGWEETPL